MRNVCEADFCNSTEILQIHHPNSKNAATIKKEVWDRVYNQFNTLYKSKYPTEEELQKFCILDKGKKGEVMHRHPGCEVWHYVSTKHKGAWFDDTNAQIKQIYTNEYLEYDSKRWHDLYAKYKKENHDNIQDIINILIDEENKKYMDFEDIQVLCNRCHFAHHKGMDLCPVCKKKYKKKQYKTCYDCKPKGL